MITHQSGLDGTGDWDRRTRRLTSFLSVLDRDQNGSPVEFNLYLPGETIFVKDGEADRVPNSLGWVPVVGRLETGSAIVDTAKGEVVAVLPVSPF